MESFNPSVALRIDSDQTTKSTATAAEGGGGADGAKQIILGSITVETSRSSGTWTVNCGSVSISPIPSPVPNGHVMSPFPWLFGSLCNWVCVPELRFQLIIGLHIETGQLLYHCSCPIKVNGKDTPYFDGFCVLPELLATSEGNSDRTYEFEGLDAEQKNVSVKFKLSQDLVGLNTDELQAKLNQLKMQTVDHHMLQHHTPNSYTPNSMSRANSNISIPNAVLSHSQSTSQLGLSQADRKRWLSPEVVDELLIRMMSKHGISTLNMIHDKVLTEYPFLECLSSRLKVLMRARLSSKDFFVNTEAPDYLPQYQKEKYWKYTGEALGEQSVIPQRPSYALSNYAQSPPNLSASNIAEQENVSSPYNSTTERQRFDSSPAQSVNDDGSNPVIFGSLISAMEIVEQQERKRNTEK